MPRLAFPVSFGTEFRLHALFFINRDIAMASNSSGFHRVNMEAVLNLKLCASC